MDPRTLFFKACGNWLLKPRPQHGHRPSGLRDASFFGTATRRLFGIYEPGRKADRAPRAAVLCHPWGQGIFAPTVPCAGSRKCSQHRDGTPFASTITALVILLAISLKPTSGGGEGIEWAIEEARATSGANRVALIGLRLGANLAASVAVRQSKEVEALILWDPMVRGSEFLSEVHALEAMISRTPPRERAGDVGGGHEILGFALTVAMAAEIGSVDLVTIVKVCLTHANARFAAYCLVH